MHARCAALCPYGFLSQSPLSDPLVIGNKFWSSSAHGYGIDPHNVTFRMVNDLVRISRFQILIGHKCIGIDRATSGNVTLDFTVKEFLATIRNHSGARMYYSFGCDSAAQACLIAIRLSGKMQIDWSALRSRSFSSFNSTERGSSALAMTISRQRRYESFCAPRGADSWVGFLARRMASGG